MQQILKEMGVQYASSEEAKKDDIIGYFINQFNQRIPDSQKPDWIFFLLGHFESSEQSVLKSACEKHPKLADRLLSYLDKRYKYHQITHQRFRQPYHSLRLLKQRVEFNTETATPVARELLNTHFETEKARQTYNMYHRSNTLLSRIAWFTHRAFAILIASSLRIASIPFTLHLATVLHTFFSQIEWGLLHFVSQGNYTKHLKEFSLNKEHFLLRLSHGLEDDQHLDISQLEVALEQAKNQYLTSTKKWPADKNGKRAAMLIREQSWDKYYLSIYREQDTGLTHLSLIAKTFYDLTTAPLVSSVSGLNALEIVFRLRYILLGVVFLTLALGIQLLTEYLPNIAVSSLVLTSLALELCSYYLLVAPFYEAKFNLQPTQASAHYHRNKSPVKISENNPMQAIREKTPVHCSYFFNRSKMLQERLLNEETLLTPPLIPANM